MFVVGLSLLCLPLPRLDPPPPLVGLLGVHVAGAVPEVHEAEGVDDR